MSTPLLHSLTLAAAGAANPLPWGRLGVVMLGTAVFLMLIAAMGRWLAATHPAPLPKLHTAAGETFPAPDSVPAELLAAISAAVHETFGVPVRVTSVAAVPPPAPSVEGLMLTWSLEGRRQIYSSHNVR